MTQIIVDASCAHLLVAKPVGERCLPVYRWIADGHGRIVYGGTLRQELFKIGDLRRLLRLWWGAGRAIDIEDRLVDDEEKRIKRLCKSNDVHVIALARVSTTRLLFTNDKPLMSDFKNSNLIENPRGQIYSTKRHTHLLHRKRQQRQKKR